MLQIHLQKTTPIPALTVKMSINVEVITEVMDTVSFLLVTPEFLGTETLSTIRNFLTNVTDYLVDHFWPYFGLTYLVVVSIFSVVNAIFNITPFDLFGSPLTVVTILRILATSMIFLAFTLGIVHFTLIITKRLFIRQAMFATGAILFFLARAISVAHSWGQPGG